MFCRQREEFRIPKACQQNFFLIKRHLECLTDFQIRHRALFGIGREIGEAIGHGQHAAGIAAAGHFLVGFDRQLISKVILSGQNPFHTRIGIGHGNEAQFIDLGFTLACITAGGFAAGGIAVKFNQNHILIGLALTEFIRTGADEFHQRIGNGFFGHNTGKT